MPGKKIFYLTFLLSTILLSPGCSDKIEPGNVEPGELPVIKAHLAVAKVTRQPFIYEAVGTVTARTASTLSSKLMGTVKAIHVQEGDFVKQGDLLVEIDERQVSARLREAREALAGARSSEASARSAREAARARARLTRSTYKRYLQLMQEESASQQEFEEVEARYRQSEASLSQTEAMLAASGHRVQQAEAAVTAAQIGEKDAKIRSPYDGKITAKMINVGDLASPGTPFLTLEKEGVHCAEFVLPEQHIQSVYLDQKVQVTIPALDEKTLEGTVGRIVPAADYKSRSFQVKVALPMDKAIRTGMFARVAVPVGEAGMLMIPSSALVRQGQLTGIYIVDAKQTARFRLIRIGRTMGDAVEVVSGIKEGNRYVVSPPPGIVNGARVEVPQ
ncbi:MAG: efflux RND transporter periplasmic adaptor subunit [Deltaproteobacteria bacterium]|nr:efflux RND transporter periplasmic adaptor subunit [Deltaproteobacteria bacterium]MBW2199332.1 efflux RND transporter periplasmic adaptor subunit [Deltaproteobacteria bacterium]MBW2538578.1 efflux RND transporter periplasmic adaptor subunit [Deltaproteobacteria bacterium]